MPDIQEYDSSVNPEAVVQTRQASGESSGAGIARLGAGIEQAGEGVQKFQSRKEIGQAANHLSGIQTQSIGQIKTMEKSMTDDQILNYMGNFDQQVDSLRGSTHTSEGSEFLEKQNRYTRDSVYSALIAKNASLQGQEAVSSYQGTEQNYSTSVYNQPDASTFRSAIDSMKSAADGMIGKSDASSQQLFASSARKVALARFEGTLLEGPGGPERAQKLLDTNELDPYIQGSDKATLQTKIQQAQRNRESQHNLNLHTSQTQLNQTQRQGFEEYYSKIDNGDVSYVELTDAQNRGIFNPMQHAALNTRLTSKINGTNSGDPALVADAINRLRLPDGDPNKISDFQTLTDEYNMGNKQGIDKNSLKMMAGMFLKPKGTGSADSAMFNKLIDDSSKQLIQPTFVPWGDRPGMAQWAKFLTQAHTDYEAGIQSGKTSQELLDPQSKSYVGQSIALFKRSRGELTAQAVYQTHGAKAASLPIGNIPEQPVGANPNMTPMPVAPARGKLSDREQAALDSMMARIPQADKGNR